MRIHQVPGDPGRYDKKKRVGRGESSGYGRTSGRGNKGAQSRSGSKKRTHFEGGQMPLARLLPKRGFSNKIFRKEFTPVNLKTLEALFESGAEITPESLKEAGIIHNSETRIKILGQGDLTKTFVVKAQAFSKTAKNKIQAKGGKCEVIQC